MALWAKLEAVSAQKAMMFATCGYQSGALEYAGSKHIATITFVAGDFLYETKATGLIPEPPPWVEFPRFAGILVREEDGIIHCTQINSDRIEPVNEWLNLDLDSA